MLFIGAVVIIGSLYYFPVQVKKPPDVLAEHRADDPDRRSRRRSGDAFAMIDAGEFDYVIAGGGTAGLRRRRSPVRGPDGHACA